MLVRCLLVVLLGTACVDAARCPNSWVEVDGYCYFISTLVLTYNDADASCADREAKLASLATDREFNVIGALVKGNKENYFVGLSRPEGTGPEGWKWDDGSLPATPPAEQWFDQELPAASLLDCAQFRWNEPSFQAQGCSNQRKYICRRDINVLDKCDYENDWHPYDGNCFKYYTSDASWQDSRETCRAARGDLAVLDTQKKLGVFAEVVNCKDFSTNIWMGLSDLDRTAEDLHWVNGVKLSSPQNWDQDDDQPKYGETADNCVAATTTRSYMWRVNQCATMNKFVCERPEGVCAAGWQTYPNMNYCYLSVGDPEQKLTWSDASNRCLEYGGNLIKATNAPEHATMVEIANSMRDAGHTQYRMGISDQQSDDIFLWDDGSPNDYKVPWEVNQPVNVVDRMDCGFVNIESLNGTWRVQYCFSLMPYVCQIPLHRVPNDIQTPPVYTCPDGWLSFGTKCYYFSGDEANYDSARSACNNLNQQAHVAHIESAEEQSFISGKLQGTSWFGLVHANGDWEWQDGGGKPVFKNWATGSKDQNLRCVRLKSATYDPGAWESADCETLHTYVCRMGAEGVGTGPTSPATPAWSPFCGSGWSYDATSHQCYKLRYDELVTWEEALARCRDDDASDLVSITTLAEQTFVNALIRMTVGGADLYWIGLNDRDLSKGWQWSDGSPVGFFFWNDGEPNNWNGNEYCVEIGPNWNDRWNDHSCDALRGYVCKKPSSKFTTPAPEVTQPPPQSTCETGGEALVSGAHYLQDEYIRSYYYSTDQGTRMGISEPHKEPWNARIDKKNEGSWQQTCPNHETDGVEEGGMYTYKDVVAVSGWEYAIVEVQACEEVHIALADSADILNAKVYEWIVGGWGNTRVAVRKCVHPCEEYTYTTTPNILDCHEYRVFWLTWRDGLIQFGSGRIPNSARIYYFKDDADLVNVQHMGLTTAWGTTGKWCVPQELPVGSAGGWTPFPADTFLEKPQELELFLLWKYILVSVSTQGGDGRDEYVQEYTVSYRLTEASRWYYVQNGETNIFLGNTDSSTLNLNTFPSPVLATYLRIRPTKFHNKPSLRIEVNGCRYETDTCPLEEPVRVNIVNDQITANGFRENHEPYHARFESPQGWIAESPSAAETDYIQIEFDRLTDIHAIMTKGHGQEQYHVKTYKFRYARNCWVWDYYQEPYGTVKTFTGNGDQDTVVTNTLRAPVRVTCARIYPMTWQGEIGMRLEFQTATCPAGCVPQALIDGDNHRIEDFALTASSIWLDDSHHGPQSSRLHLPNSQLNAGAWCAGDQNPYNDYIQADLGYSLRIYAIATQGRDGHDQWVTKYYLTHSSSGTGDSWSEYTPNGELKMFEANFNRHTVRKHYLKDWFIAHRVRLYPTEWSGHMCLRWELYGCPGGSWSRKDIGCYADSQERDLPYELLESPPGGMSRDICSAHCFDKGYEFAGAQYGKECFCGPSYGRYGVSNSCDMRCTGDHTESLDNMCGGKYANSIMTTGLSPSFTRCADGYMEYNNLCWRIESEKTASWADARTQCKYDGAELATIRNQNEMDFLMSQIELCCQDKWLWIGLHSLQNSYWFEWANGEAISYTNWARREPNSFGGEEDCVHIYPYDGTWNDESCDVYRFNYICQKSKEALPTPVPTEPDDTCPEGWSAYRWKCFMLSKGPDTWGGKKGFCEQFGGRLARIEDSAEQAFIQSKVAGEDVLLWTDLNDRDKFGTFTFTNGMAPSYTHWAQNQPDNSASASCVAMKSSELGLWYDELCDGDGQKSYGAVCERDREGETRPSTVATPAPGNCANGWVPYGNDCYQINDVASAARQTFDDAELYCSNMGAHLISVHDANENLFIYEKIGVKGVAFWLGGSRAGGGWSWTDGSVFSYANWGAGQPDEDDSKQCVYMEHNNGQWAVSSCAAHMNWICKISSNVQPHTTVAPTYPTPDPNPGACSQDSGWKLYNGKCYFNSGTSGSPDEPPPMTWYDAENYCKQHGGYLTSIHNEDTNAFITGQVLDVQSTDIWIGLNELGGGGFSWWSDGTAAAYFAWAEGSPDVNGGQMCVTMLGKYNDIGRWRNKHCSEVYHFVCAKNPGGVTITTTEPTVRPGGCPDNYKMFESKCFRFVNEPMEWSLAADKCKQEGTNHVLASISNVWEQSFLTEMLATNRNQYWIGMKMLDVSKQFGWVDNTPVNYVNWAKGEPNGGDSEQCVEMWFEDHQAGQWNDASCQSARGYVCMTLRDSNLPTPQPPSNGRCADLPEGNKWYLWNDDCYRILEEDKSWQAAEARCQQDGAHLTSILSTYENAFLHAYAGWVHADFHKTWNLWIGLSDYQNPGRYVWTDTWSPMYINWGEGQPDIKDGSCVQMEYMHGGWETLDCSYSMWSVCKHSNKDPSFTKPPSTAGCPMSAPGEDWAEYGDYCYLFMAEQKNFAGSKMECHYRNSELASVHSEEENEFIKYHTDGLNGYASWWWIGLYKTESGTLVWADDSGSNFFNWNDGEPSDTDGSEGENCVEFYTFNGKWNDVICQTNNGYICKTIKGEHTTATNNPGVSPGVTTLTTTRMTGSTGSAPPQGPSTDSPQLPPPGAGTGGMSPGGVVGLVFFLLFICLAAILTVLFVMRRRGRPIPYIDMPPSGEGVDNPVYDAAASAAVQSAEQSTAQPEEEEEQGVQRTTYDDFGGITNQDSIA